MSKSSGERQPWRFTRARQASLRKARAEHSRLVRLGEQVRSRQRYGK